MTPHVGKEAMERRPRRTHRASKTVSILVFERLLGTNREPELQKLSFLQEEMSQCSITRLAEKRAVVPGSASWTGCWTDMANAEGIHTKGMPRDPRGLGCERGGVLSPRSARWNIATPILMQDLGVLVVLRLLLPAHLLLKILQLHLPTGIKIRRSTVDDKLRLKNFANMLRAAVEMR